MRFVREVPQAQRQVRAAVHREAIHTGPEPLGGIQTTRGWLPLPR